MRALFIFLVANKSTPSEVQMKQTKGCLTNLFLTPLASVATNFVLVRINRCEQSLDLLWPTAGTDKKKKQTSVGEKTGTNIPHLLPYQYICSRNSGSSVNGSLEIAEWSNRVRKVTDGGAMSDAAVLLMLSQKAIPTVYNKWAAAQNISS